MGWVLRTQNPSEQRHSEDVHWLKFLQLLFFSEVFLKLWRPVGILTGFNMKVFILCYDVYYRHPRLVALLSVQHENFMTTFRYLTCFKRPQTSKRGPGQMSRYLTWFKRRQKWVWTDWRQTGMIRTSPWHCWFWSFLQDLAGLIFSNTAPKKWNWKQSFHTVIVHKNWNFWFPANYTLLTLL